MKINCIGIVFEIFMVSFFGVKRLVIIFNLKYL